MSVKPNEGGAAFPLAPARMFQDNDAATGMTLRDYFAAFAMNGFMQLAKVGDTDWNPAEDARSAYEVADAMIRERRK